MADNSELLERLAALEHGQWIYWNSRLPKKLHKPKLWVSYAELPESAKEKDRVFARRVVRLLVELGIILKPSKGKTRKATVKKSVSEASRKFVDEVMACGECVRTKTGVTLCAKHQKRWDDKRWGKRNWNK